MIPCFEYLIFFQCHFVRLKLMHIFGVVIVWLYYLKKCIKYMITFGPDDPFVPGSPGEPISPFRKRKYIHIFHSFHL